MSCPDVPAQLAERGVEVRGGGGCQRLRALGRHADVLLQEEPATRAARFSTRCQTAPLTTKQTGSTGMELFATAKFSGYFPIWCAVRFLWTVSIVSKNKITRNRGLSPQLEVITRRSIIKTA